MQTALNGFGQLDWMSGLPGLSVSVERLLGIAVLYGALLLGGLAADVWLVRRLLAAPVVWAVRVRELTLRPWSWRNAGFILLVLAAAHGLVFALGRAVPVVQWSAAPDSVFLLNAGAFHGTIVLAVGLVLFRRRGSLDDAFGLRRRDAGRQILRGAVYYLAALPVVVVCSLAYEVALKFLGYPLTLQNVALFYLEPRPGWLQGVMIFIGMLAAPFAEELLFRGVVLPAVAKKLGGAPAVLLLAVVFAAMHFHVPSLAPLFLLAAAFSLAYIQTGSLWVPVTMHVLFNGVNLAVLMWTFP